MKYVVLRERVTNGFKTVVFGVAPLTHRQLADAFSLTHLAVSAGFCEPTPDGKWRTFGASTSLEMKPASGDDLLISAATRATARVAA